MKLMPDIPKVLIPKVLIKVLKQVTIASAGECHVTIYRIGRSKHNFESFPQVNLLVLTRLILSPQPTPNTNLRHRYTFKTALRIS